MFRKESPIDKMIPEEAKVIRAFAGGDTNMRSRAVAIYRKYLRVADVRETNEMRFMSEIDNPCPCWVLRNKYRKAIFGKRMWEDI